MNITAAGEAAALAPSFTAFAGEGFLLTLTNRGIYNRSRKDYEALTGEIKLSVEDGALAVDLGEVRVILNQKIAESRCSCPSKTTCKHVLMALFAAAELAARGENTTGTAVPDFAELEHANLELLKKEAGKKMYEEAIRAVADGYGAKGMDCVKGDMLAAEIEAYGVTVYFPRKFSIGAAVCKCGEKGLCKHKLIAVFSYLKDRNLLDPAEEAESFLSVLPGPSVLALLETAKQYTISLFEKGLISADDTDIEGAQQLSLKFEGEGVGNLSRLFRGLATDIENMLSKNAGFKAGESFSTLSRIYNTASAILAHRTDQEFASALIEKSRSSYRAIPAGTFTGLGAHPWQTRSGFTGVTALVFHQEKKAILSYTVSMADFYEKTKDAANQKNLEALWKREDHWDTSVSLKAVSEGKFSLRNFKTNEEGRISSSKETRYQPEGKTVPADLASILTISDSAIPELSAHRSMAEEQSYDYFAKRSAQHYHILFAEGITDCSYDRVNQILRFSFRAGPDKEAFPGIIPYSEINLGAIGYIENMAKTERPERWFICAPERRGLIPLSAVTEKGVENFYF
ncbi:hypothetical protein FACS1894151_04370 [Spirochaetia bacterium]|nr:hypothetical protein FACS1894151_04370 [Spirochaetia bacterium]